MDSSQIDLSALVTVEGSDESAVCGPEGCTPKGYAPEGDEPDGCEPNGCKPEETPEEFSDA